MFTWLCVCIHRIHIYIYIYIICIYDAVYVYVYVYIYIEREIELFMVVYVALQVSYPKTPKALTQSVAHPWCEGAMAIVARFGHAERGSRGIPFRALGFL